MKLDRDSQRIDSAQNLPRLSRTQKNWLLALAVCFSFALALVGAEIFCRFAKIPFKERDIMMEASTAKFDPELGWSYIPFQSRIFGYAPAKLVSVMHFNEQGIRVRRPEPPLDPSRPSVLFIGCSFTMGHGVDYNDTLPGQFEKINGGYLQSVNMGVQGYGTDQALLTLERHIRAFNTKAVVYVFLDSHVTRNANYDPRLLHPKSRYIGTKPLFKLDKHGKLFLAQPPKKFEDYPHSRLLSMLQIALNWHPRADEVTRSLVMKMKEVSEKSGAEFFVVTWRWKGEKESILKKLDLNLVDTLEAPPLLWDEMYIKGDGHPLPAAYEYVAWLLLKHFKEKGMIRPVGEASDSKLKPANSALTPQSR